MLPRFFCLTSVALAAITPLTDSQTERARDARDLSGTFDEPAFYALLENAAAWQPTLAGAVVPDYTQLFNEPEKHRGQYCLIEGTLIAEWIMPKLARGGWEQVRAFAIEYQPDHYLIVFLTHPDAIGKSQKNTNGIGLLAEKGARVKVGARFFKLLTRTNQAGQPKTYFTFVGHAFNALDRTAAHPRRARGLEVALPIALIVVLLGAYALIRRKTSRSTSRIDDFHRRHALRGGERLGPVESAEAPHDVTDLPDNPADALEALDRCDSQES